MKNCLYSKLIDYSKKFKKVRFGGKIFNELESLIRTKPDVHLQVCYSQAETRSSFIED